ncbi:MAG: choice-of-anchor J domain-containing protein [Sphingobacteriales bacterium]|nr:MAG: choice-of-anchor J domain-containing protein [Sphingobacteriales bacterium]
MLKYYTDRVFLCFLVSILFGYSLVAQPGDNSDRNLVFKEKLVIDLPELVKLPNQYRSFSFDIDRLKKTLELAPLEFTEEAKNTAGLPVLTLPMPWDQNLAFNMVESPVMEPGLAEQMPETKTYFGWAANGIDVSMRLTVTSSGIYALIHTYKGLVAIEPLRNSVTKNMHLVFADFDLLIPDFVCNTAQPSHGQLPGYEDVRGNCGNMGSALRQFRIAIAATGELTTQYGGVSGASDFIVATLNGINLVFEREMSVRMTLIAENNSVIFSNAATDPFDPSAASLPINAHAGIVTVLNTSQFDMGHVIHFGASNSGIAGFGVVCTNSAKGRGWSTYFNLFFSRWVLLVAHEFGHQFGATHSFYGTESNCSARTASGAYEPGSGTTIMSYQGICGSQNIGSVREDYFHAISLQQMRVFINGISCNTTIATGNTIPVSNANPLGGTYTIPIQKPFEMTGTGTDADGNAITYCWEEFDSDGTAGGAPNDAANSTTAPLFRSFYPTTNPNRTFPQLSDLLNNTQTIGEILPNVSRTINMRLTVRDNNPLGGAFDCDATSVTVSNTSGPFTVTSQNSPTTWNANGTNTATVTWDVANTTSAPVSCANVDILFSTNAGQTFPYSLATNTPNDGTQTFVIPSFPTTVGRVKVKCANNIFFDINNAPITISSPCAANAASVTPTTSVTSPAGTPALDLSLTPTYGSAYPNFSGNLSTSDSQSYLPANNGSGVCTSFPGNATRFDSYPFMVSVSGNYTFTRAGGTSSFIVMHVYNGAYNPQSPCTNWIASSYNTSTTINSSTLNVALAANINYTFVLSTFNASLPATLPSNYTINFTPPGGGGVYNGIPSPPAGYAYTYIMVNNGTGLITGINGSSDLSDSNTFTPANYHVYGFSYQTATIPNLNVLIGMSQQTLQNNLDFLVYCGQLSSNFVLVTVEPGASCALPPAPTITPPSNTNLCMGNIQLTASALPGGFPGYGYQWYQNSNPVFGAINQSFYPESGGNFTVVLVNGECVTAQSNTISLTETPPSALSIVPETITLCEGNSALLTASALNPMFPFHSYRWLKNGVTIPGQNNATLMVTETGNYTVQAYFNNACASAPSNISAVTVIPQVGLPYNHDFSAGFPPTGWTLQNPDGNLTWGLQTTPCYLHAAFLNFFNYPNQGQQDYLVTPLINLNGVGSAGLSFDVAYARYNDSFFDGLQVQISTDCGQNYTTIYNKSGNTLATAPDISTSFSPTDCSQWRNEIVDLSAYVGNSVLLRFVGLNGYGNNLFVDNVNISGSISAGVRVEAILLLEGAFNNVNQNMNTILNSNNLLPFNQPFNASPWNYSGTESIVSFPSDVVDWVLIYVLDPSDNLIARKAALLQNDGVILNTDGSNGIVFTSGLSAGNSYRLLVRHRNHVAVVGNNTIVLPNTNTPYNFTIPANVRNGADQLANLGNGLYGLRASDANSNGVVNYQDYNIFIIQNGQNNGYFNADFNLDGQVEINDFILYNLRAGSIGLSLVRY